MNKYPPYFVVVPTLAEPPSDVAHNAEQEQTQPLEPEASGFERSGPERSLVHADFGFAIRIGAMDSLAEIVDLAMHRYGQGAEGYELSVGTFVIRYLDRPPEPGDTVVFPKSLEELFTTSRFARAEITSIVVDQFKSRFSSQENRYLRLKLLRESHAKSSTRGE